MSCNKNGDKTSLQEPILNSIPKTGSVSQDFHKTTSFILTVAVCLETNLRETNTLTLVVSNNHGIIPI